MNCVVVEFPTPDATPVSNRNEKKEISLINKLKPMSQQPISIRPFIGSIDFDLSRNFYRDFGMQEVVLSDNMSLFTMGAVGFYLQKAYVKDWVDNTMVFLEVPDVQEFWETVNELGLQEKYPTVKLLPIRNLDWGSEFFVHDPAGVLWHIGAFNKTV